MQHQGHCVEDGWPRVLPSLVSRPRAVFHCLLAPSQLSLTRHELGSLDWFWLGLTREFFLFFPQKHLTQVLCPSASACYVWAGIASAAHMRFQPSMIVIIDDWHHMCAYMRAQGVIIDDWHCVPAQLWARGSHTSLSQGGGLEGLETPRHSSPHTQQTLLLVIKYTSKDIIIWVITDLNSL